MALKLLPMALVGAWDKCICLNPNPLCASMDETPWPFGSRLGADGDLLQLSETAMAAPTDHQPGGVPFRRPEVAHGRDQAVPKSGECPGRDVIWKLLLVAEKRFLRLKAPELMKGLYQGAKYVNGLPVNKVSEEKAA